MDVEDALLTLKRGLTPQKIIDIFQNSPEYEESKINNFKILKELGSGFFGAVFLAYDKVHDIYVALKAIILDRSNPGSDDTYKSVNYEIENLKKISNYPNCNENIACYYDSFFLDIKFLSYESCAFIVTEYIDGITFSEFSKLEPTNMNNKIIWDILYQTTKGLAYIHSKNIAHRDLHGSNIMINNNGVIKYIDFGISCFEENCKKLPPSGFTISLKNKNVTFLDLEKNKAMDTWALGNILYQFITGKYLITTFNEYLIDINYFGIFDKFIHNNIKKNFKFEHEDEKIVFLITKMLDLDNQQFTSQEAYEYVLQNNPYNM